MIRLLALASATTLCGCSNHLGRLLANVDIGNEKDAPSSDMAEVTAKKQEPKVESAREEITEEMLNDARARSRYFERDFPDDIYLTGQRLELAKSLVRKFRGVQRHVGHGNFNVLGMDEFFHICKNSSSLSMVTAAEADFLEELFFFEAKNYGFQGEKVFHRMTDQVNQNAILKIPYTGHYLRKGKPIETYNKIIRDVGDSLILTSGVRGIAKQYHLFFEEALEGNGNLSKASRSLAPPGYSFHGKGDFDIGKRGFGHKNFTDDFATTEEFKKLVGLGYAEIRYTESNQLGVRFEPWHIKVDMDV